MQRKLFFPLIAIAELMDAIMKLLRLLQVIKVRSGPVYILGDTPWHGTGPCVRKESHTIFVWCRAKAVLSWRIPWGSWGSDVRFAELRAQAAARV